ncbi:MAG: gliding motility protein GldL [Paramuribaculum sp.]|nr:gliding motility protein GldL [Paramuribaculum sp.]
MGNFKQYKSKIQNFISGENGQRFFNVAYSVGAAVVILGALFKILHLPAGNALLSIGMGTEVLMFILTAFDRPKREYQWENVFPVLSPDNDSDDNDSAPVIIGGTVQHSGVVTGSPVAGAPVISASGAAAPVQAVESIDTPQDLQQSFMTFAEQMAQLKETAEQLNEVGRVLLDSYKVITDNSDNITANSQGYVRQMEALNHNISGLNTIYEIQLKSVSSQLDSIDRVNRGIRDISDMYETTARQSRRFCEESEQMTRHMQQLNTIYANMLQAMTIGMPVPRSGINTPPAASSQPESGD